MLVDVVGVAGSADGEGLVCGGVCAEREAETARVAAAAKQRRM